MISNPKWISLVLGNCILLFLMQLINDSLASFTINLFPYALFILIPTLLVPYTTGLISVFITGLILDASSTLLPGTTAILLSIVYTPCYWSTQRFKTYSAKYNMAIILLLNAIIFIFLTILINHKNYSSKQFLGSISLNLLLSQILILCITPWFFSLQCGLIKLLTLKTNNTHTNTSNEKAH